MLPNFTQALQSAAARRNLSSPGTSLGFKNPRINPVPIAEPTNARDMDLNDMNCPLFHVEVVAAVVAVAPRSAL